MLPTHTIFILIQGLELLQEIKQQIQITYLTNLCFLLVQILGLQVTQELLQLPLTIGALELMEVVILSLQILAETFLFFPEMI